MRLISLAPLLILLSACGGTKGEDAATPRVETGDQAAAPVAAPDPMPEPANGNEANQVEVASVSPCLMQGADRLDVKPMRAVGTEPFWGARIEGRCVTYSHPEDQQGTRVWTRFSPGPNGSAQWVGQLDGKPFELRTSPQPGCSDGMSDKVYPTGVELLVNGERRRGCAEPA